MNRRNGVDGTDGGLPLRQGQTSVVFIEDVYSNAKKHLEIN